MVPYAIKIHKITVLSSCKLSVKVCDTCRKHPSVNGEAGSEEFSYFLTAHTFFKQCILKCSVHINSYSPLTFLFVTSSMCWWVSLIFLIAAGILDRACIFPNKFPGAVGHLFAVTKLKMNCQETQLYTNIRKHIWGHVQLVEVALLLF